ncbi:putative helicase MOV-10 [Temnothorax nylanderi]|uniref:putative helicase MOV-10 n=1 Tax=Temnothorax nylanderi TaxID=102681 RepID=UPI003A8C0C3F
MQRRKEREDFMSITAPALMPRLTLPSIIIPSQLCSALKSIYCPKLDSTSRSNLHNNYKKCINSLSNVQTIIQRDYLTVLKICLYLIQFEEDLELKRFKLLNHTVKTSDLENCFIISLKSLNDDLHIIKPDCEVHFRDNNTRKVIFAKVVKVVGNDVTIKPYYAENAKTLNMMGKRFNIEFVDRHWSLRCCHYALKIVSKCNWFEIAYPRLRTNCTDMEIDIEWINADMKENEPQKQAVRKILNKTAYPAPYIIFGPPGTGKTATLVETICQIVRQFPTKNILVCTSSNAAADEITKRLIKYIPTNLIHRMYAPSREWSTVKNEIQSCANFVQESTLFLSKELLLRKKIIITTLVSSVRLIDVNFRENHFSYIIIDEASQAVEPEMLIPLAITNKESDEKTRFHAQIVIAGDPYQLGPVVCSKRIEHLLGKSMLERLMDDCDPYKKQDGKYNPNYITKLVQNFRSHENILHVSNKQFYCGDLKICGGADIRMALNWSQLPNKNFPMIFQEVLGTETRSANRSVCNTAEVLAVLMYVSILIKAKFGKHVITPKDIGIVTPFKQQQLDITHHLEAMKLKGITVGTVETFQGQERNVMILSTVRSKVFEHNDKEHIGFLSNPKRFNVALTRAKALMIIIGNPNILCKNEHWEVLWKYCKKHNANIPFEQLPLNKDVVTKLKGNSKVKSCNGSGPSRATELSVTVELGEEDRTKTFDELVCKMEKLKLKKENLKSKKD